VVAPLLEFIRLRVCSPSQRTVRQVEAAVVSICLRGQQFKYVTFHILEKRTDIFFHRRYALCV